MSAPMVEYGIACAPSEEKKIIKAINAFLATLEYRKIYKTNNASLLQARLPHRYAHYYWQMLKQHPRWYFELYPNADLDGKIKFPHHPDVGWVLFTTKPYNELNSSVDDENLEKFFADLIGALRYEVRVLHRYSQGDERL